MNPDIYALSVLSQCKAKEFKSSDCKHADYTAFLLVHFQFQRPFQIFRARFQQSLGSSLAFRQQHDVVRVTDKYNSTLLILLVKLIQIDVCRQGGKISSLCKAEDYAKNVLFFLINKRFSQILLCIVFCL